MNHASLAARYRPQTFAEVTGQDTVKAILSRASLEDRVAPAYLLSGTRGVGKTTIARIFAKALNCTNAPAAEPCNTCTACKRITQGNYVDVVEIDGASNRGIDDARRLRESIGYAPMEGRYKVFIIDEAHMLTRDAFNALLKTLEEPPARVTFILATTEAHKFPVTIVSRCQHFIFKALSEAVIVSHLEDILRREAVQYDLSAVQLLARRAAGSVRDSMSLLGQTMAIGGSLTEETTRSVLGLAGQELYQRLLYAFKEQDCVAVAALTKELLERGVDLGFFLRELAQLWRNLFLLRQAGADALRTLDLPESEQQRLLELAPDFHLTTIHAAWQMVLESQRQVLTSLEPAAALELLLLNIALLPRLLGMDVLSRAQSNTLAAVTSEKKTISPHNTDKHVINAVKPSHIKQDISIDKQKYQEQKHLVTSARQVHPLPVSQSNPTAQPQVEQLKENQAGVEASRLDQPYTELSTVDELRVEQSTIEQQTVEPHAAEQSFSRQPQWPCAWEEFVVFCREQLKTNDPLSTQLTLVQGRCEAATLTIQPQSRVQYEWLCALSRQEQLQALAKRCAGKSIEVLYREPPNTVHTESELKQHMSNHEAVKVLTEHFDATLLRCAKRVIL